MKKLLRLAFRISILFILTTLPAAREISPARAGATYTETGACDSAGTGVDCVWVKLCFRSAPADMEMRLSRMYTEAGFTASNGRRLRDTEDDPHTIQSPVGDDGCHMYRLPLPQKADGPVTWTLEAALADWPADPCNSLLPPGSPADCPGPDLSAGRAVDIHPSATGTLSYKAVLREESLLILKEK